MIKIDINKYQEQIAAILNCEPNKICFYWNGNSIESLIYAKGDNFGLGSFTVRVFDKLNKQSYISSWDMYEMPHCCAFAISTRVYVNNDYRNKGIGTILNNFRKDIAKELGYTALLCTDIEQNTPQRNILKKNGWIDIFDVVNKRTKNKVYLSVVKL